MLLSLTIKCVQEVVRPLLMCYVGGSYIGTQYTVKTKVCSYNCTPKCPNTHTKRTNSVCIGIFWCAVHTFVFTVNLFLSQGVTTIDRFHCS